MTRAFVSSLEDIFILTTENVTQYEYCEEEINHYTFYQMCLIPSILITMVFFFTRRRRNILKDLFHGRPGMIFPMDALTRSSRLSFACAFGATSLLVYQIVIDQKYAIEYNGHRAVKTFVGIGSMFIYGMVFFPIFSSLAIGSAFSFGVGALYVWALTAVNIFKLAECDLGTKDRVLVVFRGLPNVLCYVYLCISMPVRMVHAFKKGKYFYWDEEENMTIEDIRDSYAGHHVMGLLKKPVVVLPPGGKKDRILLIAKGLWKRIVYERQKGFRYSARMITVVLISSIVLYTVAFELLALIPAYVESFQDILIFYMDFTIGLDPISGEDREITSLRDMLYIVWWLLGIMRISTIVSAVVAGVFAMLNILHTLSSYRANLFAMYRGEYTHIPPLSAYSNVSHCVNCIKYAGFQVGYTIWSYLLQFSILALISFIISFIILAIIYDFTGMLLMILDYVWPIILTILIIMIGQMLLAKFFFLQERGAHMALDNRSFFFTFAYFMFFYNIFLGLVSCLVRILKAMLVGIAFLGRLDSSTLPRKFEFLDPGFKAYVGYMHVEAAHTHPVVVTFCRLMTLGLHNKRNRVQARQQATEGSKANIEVKTGGDSISSSGLVAIEMKSKQSNGIGDDDIQIAKSMSEEEWRRKMGARFSWHVAFTLLHNPDIRVMRKGYVHMLRQAKLLGISIPVSDTQADINFDELQKNIADAKEMLNPAKKKNGAEQSNDEKEEGKIEEVKVKGGLEKKPTPTETA